LKSAERVGDKSSTAGKADFDEMGSIGRRIRPGLAPGPRVLGYGIMCCAVGVLVVIAVAIATTL